jgi:hypothetical protein
MLSLCDHLSGPLVRVPSYRSRGPGFDSWPYHVFWVAVGLERGPLSLVRITEEQLEWKVAAPTENNETNGRENPLRLPLDNHLHAKVSTKFRQQVAAAQSE